MAALCRLGCGCAPPRELPPRTGWCLGSPSRAGLSVTLQQRLLQPTRAIPRRNIAAGIALAQAVDESEDPLYRYQVHGALERLHIDPPRS